MKLNCDLGESYGMWQLGQDELVMPHIDMANIACGFHAGDPHIINKTLALAKQHNTMVGAHPSYPDTLGFGRRSMKCSQAEIIDLMLYQIAALDGMAQSQGLTLSYVKPHGALYNDMMADSQVFTAILHAMQQYYRPLKLMILAGSNAQKYQNTAQEFGVELLLEAFADRRYTESGSLTPRSQSGAVLDKVATLAQVKTLISSGQVVTDTGKAINLDADTICVHGDNVEAVNLVKEIKDLCQEAICQETICR
ncbi:5-oxoprolinase subunit PxpA [Paraglaciecola aquimarina]|uniref:5-oxoprolinase subunit PxpA n=1 Tax=Paraglaciecola algarum TaxID=3050085 RepID=A0ABS9D4E7_9ALTE|nr:5-oxoprolinase subunit PxpA [Paraglaciecola sp. G1-23]MCF2947793.1 5-oxoprolinase subunit PxpA [Paraglaciecola sp. G1-23]